MMQEKFRVPARVLDVIELDAYGNNLLQYACDEGWVELVEELLRGEGMNIDQQNKFGWTALEMLANEMIGDLKSTKIMKILLKLGASTAISRSKDHTVLDVAMEGVSMRAEFNFPPDIRHKNKLKLLVEDFGLPITQNVLKVAALDPDPEVSAMCQHACSSPRSLKKLARLVVWKTHNVDKMPDGYIPEELKFFLGFKEGDDE